MLDVRTPQFGPWCDNCPRRFALAGGDCFVLVRCITCIYDMMIYVCVCVTLYQDGAEETCLQGVRST